MAVIKYSYIKYSYTTDTVVKSIQDSVAHYVTTAKENSNYLRVYNNTVSFYVKKYNNYNAHGGVSVEEIQTKLNQMFHEFVNKKDILGYRLLVSYDWDNNFWDNFNYGGEKKYDSKDICIINYDMEDVDSEVDATEFPCNVITIADFLNNHVFITVKFEFGVC